MPQRLVDYLRTRLSILDDPRSLGEPLTDARLGAYWKYRVGEWRIICDIQDDRIVVRVLRLGNRREVYRGRAVASQAEGQSLNTLAQEAWAERVAARGPDKRLHEAPGPIDMGLPSADRTVPHADGVAQHVQQARRG